MKYPLGTLILYNHFNEGEIGVIVNFGSGIAYKNAYDIILNKVGITTGWTDEEIQSKCKILFIPK